MNLEDVMSQAYAELGTDKSPEALTAYINRMDNVELLELMDRAREAAKKREAGR